MSLHVCVLGIDGSGKSTVVSALPAILAAEHGLVVGSASESFRIVAPDEDHLAKEFYPDGLPLAARLSLRFKRLAKRFADHPKLYTVFKLAQMLSQDSAAETLAQRHGTRVFISDGNTFLSTTGRASNYLRAASAVDQASASAPEANDLEAVFKYILDDKPVPVESSQRLPSLRKEERRFAPGAAEEFQQQVSKKVTMVESLPADCLICKVCRTQWRTGCSVGKTRGAQMRSKSFADGLQSLSERQFIDTDNMR